MGKRFALASAFACALAFGASPAFADEMDDLFSDSGSLAIEEAKQIENPEKALFADSKFVWAGDVTGTAGAGYGLRDAIPEIDDWTDGDDSLLLELKARLLFDARPDDDFRVFGKFTLEYPFESEAVSADDATETVSVANVGVFELFCDFDWKERAYFRFGKQNTGWGVSRFYQVADPLSVGVKDPTDPDADLEGPVALKMTIPLGLNSLVFISAIKRSYLPEDANEASIRDVGAGVKADIYVKMPDNRLVGNGQLSLGFYGQRNLAPKAVASYSTSVGKFQIFTDQVGNWGLDSARLTGDDVTYSGGAFGPVTVGDTERPRSDPFYAATAGTMYVNNDWHFTLYAEYLYNGAGSSDGRYYREWLARYEAERNTGNGIPSTLDVSDLGSYLGKHNSALSLSWSELLGNDDFGFSVTWMQNWIDLSGMARPAFTWKPIKHLKIETGANLTWGDDETEWVLKNAKSGSFEPVRTSGYLVFKLDNSKF